MPVCLYYKKVDRIITRNKRVKVKKYAMEDFCQLEGRLTVDKYRGSYERCAKIVSRYSSQKGRDLSALFLRLVVSFVTGNSDMHLKNYPMIETEPDRDGTCRPLFLSGITHRGNPDP